MRKDRVAEREVKTNGLGIYATKMYVSQRATEIEFDRAFKAYKNDNYYKFVDVKLTVFPSTKLENDLYSIVRTVAAEAFKKGHGIEPNIEVVKNSFTPLSKYFTVRDKKDLKDRFVSEWKGSNQKAFLDETVNALAYVDEDTKRNLIKARVLDLNKIEIGIAGYIKGEPVPYYITAYTNFGKSGYHILFIDAIKGTVCRLKAKDIVIDRNRVMDADTGELIVDCSKPEKAEFYNGMVIDAFGSIPAINRNTSYLEVCLGSTYYHKQSLNKRTHIKNHVLIMLMRYGYEVMKYIFCFNNSGFLVVDHIDGNGFNNEMANLQLISNGMNIKKFEGDRCFNFADYFKDNSETMYYKMQDRLIA